MMANVLESIAVFGIIETFVFDLPAAFGHAVQAAAAHLTRGEVSEPVGIDDRAVLMMLAIANHAHGLPPQAFPRIQIIGVPDLDTIGALPELEVWRLGVEAPLSRSRQFGQIVLKPGHHGPSRFSCSVQKRGGCKSSVDYHVINEARSQVRAHATQQTLPRGVFAVTRPIGFDIRGQGEWATHHRRQDQVMTIAEDLSLAIAVGTAQGASLLSSSPAGRAIQSQADEMAVLESLIALGATEHVS